MDFASLPEGGEIQVPLSDEEVEETAIKLILNEELRERHKAEVTPTRVRRTMSKALPDSDRTVRLIAEVPLVHLLMLDCEEARQPLLNLLWENFSRTDFQLVGSLAKLADALHSSSPPQRTDALKEFALEYLKSASFLLKRDVRQGFKRLAEHSLSEFDAFLGLHNLSSEAGGTHPFAIAGKEADSLPLETRYALLLLTGSYDEIRSLAESIRKHLDQEEAGQRGSLFRNLYLQAVGSSHLFAAALAFYLIAYLIHNTDHIQMKDEDGQSVRAIDWARSYIAFMLNASDHVGIVGGEGTVSESPHAIAEQEMLRRQAHAAALRLAVWTAASQQHVNELASKALSPDDIVKGWLLRGLVLSDRVLSMLIMESKAEPTMILLRPCDRDDLSAGFFDPTSHRAGR